MPLDVMCDGCGRQYTTVETPLAQWMLLELQHPSAPPVSLIVQATAHR
jgi:hypothetical protein